MTIKVPGALFKRFYSDPAAWPGADGETYHDDAVIIIDGVVNGDIDVEAISDAARVSVEGGFLVSCDARINGKTLEEHLKDWMAHQSVHTLVVEVEQGNLSAVFAAVEAAGGTILVSEDKIPGRPKDSRKPGSHPSSS